MKLELEQKCCKKTHGAITWMIVARPREEENRIWERKSESVHSCEFRTKRANDLRGHLAREVIWCVGGRNCANDLRGRLHVFLTRYSTCRHFVRFTGWLPLHATLNSEFSRTRGYQPATSGGVCPHLWKTATSGVVCLPDMCDTIHVLGYRACFHVLCTHGFMKKCKKC